MPRTLPLALLAGRAAHSSLERTCRQERLSRRDPPHHRRRPARQGQGLRLARLRLRLCVRAGSAVRVRRHHRHGQRAALALLRHHRRLAQRRHEPAVGLLLAADPRRAHRRAAEQAQGAARPGEEGARHGQGVRGGLQRLPAQDRPRQAAGPDLPRQGVGAPDHDDGRLPPLLPARPARELGQLPQGDRQRRPALGRRGGARRVGADPGAVRARDRERPRARHGAPARLQRLRRRLRRHPRRPLGRARQPALPVAGLRALVRDAPHDPRQARRDRRRPAGRAGRQHRLQQARRLEPHGLDRAPLHAVRAQAQGGRPAQLHGRRQGREDEAPHGQGAHPVRRRSATRSTRPAGGRCSTTRWPA